MVKSEGACRACRLGVNRLSWRGACCFAKNVTVPVDAEKATTQGAPETAEEVPEAQYLETAPAVGETWHVQDSNLPEFQSFRTVLVKAIREEDGTAK